MEQQITPTILFPYDFSKESECALEYLSSYSGLYPFALKFLNILDLGTRKYMAENRLSKAGLEQKMSQMAFDFQTKYGVNSTYMVQNAPVKRIRKISLEEEVTFTMIGISEPKRYSAQIMKVVSTSPVPIFVIQDGVTFKPYNKILFPLTDAVNNRQKAGWALRIAKRSNGTVHIFSMRPDSLDTKDDAHKQRKVIESVERFFGNNGVKFKTEIAKGSYKNFTKEALSHADEIGADLLIIMIAPKKLFKPFNTYDFNMIFNPLKIPIFCVNQRDLFVSGGFH